MSGMICVNCVNFMNDVKCFRSKVNTMQLMFNELQQVTELTPDEAFDIRSRYGLSHEQLVEMSEEDPDNIKEAKVECDDKIEFVNDDNQDEFDEEYLDVDENESVYCDKPKPSSSRKLYQKRKLEKTDNEKLYEFRCHICASEFPKMQLLTVHCRTIHQTNPQVLCFCGVKLSTWKRLMAHKSKHIKEDDEYKCSWCNISYKTKTAFDKHVKAKHGPDAVKFVCAHCGKQFKEKQILKNHEKVHLPDELKLKHPCLQCSKKFVNSHCLKIHIAR